MKIVFLDMATLADLPAELAKFADLGEYVEYGYTAPEQLLGRLDGAAVAITNKVYLGEETIAALPALRLICISATGKNNVDLEAAAARNIPVLNVAGYSTASVAQWTLTAVNALAMDLIHLNEAVYDGTYAASPHFSYWRRPFYELTGKRYGIVGLGAIGRAVAKLAVAFGAEVVYHSTSGSRREEEYPAVSLDELLTTCDVISLHCPLNATTENLLGYAELQRMKPSAYLVNAGRGGIVNEAALARALNEELLAGAATDVFASEPPPPDHPYFSLRDRSRLLLTPHVAWASVEARTELLRAIRENITSVFG